MLALDDPRWGELRHAYGPATDTPGLLERVQRDAGDEEAWYELWGSICHQGSTYPASFAAVPHLVAIAAAAAPHDRVDALHLVATIAMGAYDVPVELEREFHDAIARIPPLAEAAFATDLDEAKEGYPLVALAVGHGCLRAAFVIESVVSASDVLLRCPSDDCAVEISASPSKLVVDEDESDVSPTTARGAAWTEDTAIIAAADAAERAGRRELADDLRGLGGTAVCPVCETPIEIWPRLLAGDDL